MFFQKYVFGDTALYYAEAAVEGHDNKTVIGLAAFPKEYDVTPGKLCLDSLVQVAFMGDETLIDYTPGVTMRNRNSTLLRVEEQTADENGVVTRLTDGAGNRYTHFLRYYKETGVFSVQIRYQNDTDGVRTLESLQSFSLSGIHAPKAEEITTRGLTLYRMTSAWSRECRLKADAFHEIGMDMSWARYGVKCERFGQVGSMPNRGYYPFAAVKDGQSGVVWGVTLEAPFSWQIELYKEKETCALSCGLADYEFGHWRKQIPPKGTFETHLAFFTVKGQGGVNAVCNAFVHTADARLRVPDREESLPILFNEYCTTWGSPSEQKIEQILQALKPFPIDYFVIDSGWYKPEDRNWCNAIGDWNENQSIFPGGLKKTVQNINAAGMRAGIWFEYEIAGRDSDYFYREENLLKRDGFPITTKNRRFLDLRKQDVQDYLDEKVIKFLKENGFEYLKVDYNDTYGVGCDAADGSLGEGGRVLAEKSLDYFRKIAASVPNIVIENCSSGGSRIEPLRMNNVSMCSFSDAHECTEIPIVAANVSRVIPARQMQIWAVLRDSDSPSRIIYSLCAAMMGRICLSGDVLQLTAEKTELIARGLEFYNAVKEIVRRGDITEIDCDVEYYRAPKGRQIYIKEYQNERLVFVHLFEGVRKLCVPMAGYRLKAAYTDLKYEAHGQCLELSCDSDFRAGVFCLERL